MLMMKIFGETTLHSPAVCRFIGLPSPRFDKLLVAAWRLGFSPLRIAGMEEPNTSLTARLDKSNVSRCMIATMI